MPTTFSRTSTVSSPAKIRFKELSMTSVVEFLQSGLAAIANNSALKQYAEPVLLAIFTGASVITIPQGVISISQADKPTRFTLGLAAIALETFVMTDDIDIKIGTTRIDFVPNSQLQHETIATAA